MIDYNDIPEGKRVCVNCKYWTLDDDVTNMCCGDKPCSNYISEHTENYFVPDDDFLRMEYACRACKHYNDCSYDDECSECSRYFEDKWERQDD